MSLFPTNGRSLRPAAAILASCAVFSACEEELPVGVVDGPLPGEPITVEVEIPWSDFASNLEVFGGYGSPAELGVGFVPVRAAVAPDACYDLRPGGALALVWNIPLDRYSRHPEAYRRYAPELLGDLDQRVKRRDAHNWGVDMETAGFVDIDRCTHRWNQEMNADDYRALYSTYSDHMLLAEPDRSRLLDALAADVESWGGTATVEYRTEVFSGRKPD